MNGLGGIGKTVVADVYVSQFRDNYKYVAKVFVSGDLRQSLVNGLGRQLGIEFIAGDSLQTQFEMVIARLQLVKAKKPSLLLLDNANDKDDLIKYKKVLKSSGWKVLLTSRCNPTDYTKLAVDELSPDDAKELFLHHYPVDGDLSLLLEKIHYHTLLIELVAKVGEANCLSIAELVEKLELGLKHDDLQIEIEIGSHADSQNLEKQTELYLYVSAMFDPELFDDDKKLILRYFSVLPARGILREHLEKMFGLLDKKFRNDLNELFKFGWLSKKGASYWMHGLVQDVMFTKLGASLESCGDLVRALNGIMNSGDGGFLLDAKAAWDCQEYAQSVALKFKEPDRVIGWLNIYLADFYKNTGNLESALASITLAREHFEQLNDKENLAISYERLDSIHQTMGQVDKALEFFELYNKLTKELYKSNPKSESLKNGLAISYEKLGDIHQTMGQVDKALEFFKLYNKLSKELNESNPKNVELKSGLAISYRKLADIHQTKIPFFKFALKRYNQPVLAMHEKAITLWQELYQTTELDSHKQSLEKAETANLQAKIISYAPIIQATIVTIFAGLYSLDWISVWWLIGLFIWLWPLRLPPKEVLSIKILILGLLGLIAWFN